MNFKNTIYGKITALVVWTFKNNESKWSTKTILEQSYGGKGGRVDEYEGQPKKMCMKEINGILTARGLQDDFQEDRTEWKKKIN